MTKQSNAGHGSTALSARNRVSRTNGRGTRAVILNHAKAELEQHGPVKFSILRVIERSGVARSSVYHHFVDRDGLISAVEVERLIEENRSSNELLRLVVNTASSAEEVFSLIEHALHAASSPEGRASRAHRIAVVAAAQNIPALQDALVEQSRNGDEYLAETLEIARARGFINPQLTTLSIAQLIATLFIGRITVDGYNSQDDDASWIHATMFVLKQLMVPR